MQVRRAWPKVLVGVAVGVLLCAATMAPVTAAQPGRQTPCGPTPPGLVPNVWQRQMLPHHTGVWSNPRNWSRNHAPGPGDFKQFVCIRTAAKIVMLNGEGLLVQVGAIDIGGTSAGDAQIVLLPTNTLLVWSPARKVVSKVASGSRLRLKGAALGGGGRIEIRGELDLDAAPGRPNVLTTHGCGTVAYPAPGSCPTAPGKTGTAVVEPGGLMLVNGGPTTVRDGYQVEVSGGQLVMAGLDGQVSAEAGTGLTLDASHSEPVTPALEFHNDGGWYAGADPYALLSPTRVSIDGAVVKKVTGEGTSAIQGAVTASRRVQADVRSGTLAIAGIDSSQIESVLTAHSSYSTGSCAPDSGAYGCTPIATVTDAQIATVTVPGHVSTPTTLRIREVATSEEAIGDATVIEGSPPPVTRKRPLVLELRYDASVIGALDAQTGQVEVAQKKTYRPLPDCTSGGRIRNHQSGCVDRARSHIDPDGDLVMVVRTLHFSRYICH
jgi:hypothetical protein